MLGYFDRSDGEREKRKILDRASKKHGGQTTTWKVIHTLKTVAQKHDVADIIQIEATKGGGVKVIVSDRIHTRLSATNKTDTFFSDLMESVYDCGYNFAVGDGYFEIHKV